MNLRNLDLIIKYEINQLCIYYTTILENVFGFYMSFK